MLTNATIREREGYAPCNTSVHNTSGTNIFSLKKKTTKQVLDLKRTTHDETHCIKPTEEEEEEEEEGKKRFVSHYLVSVKNRNSPVTFTLHVLIIYTYVQGFLVVISHCP